MQVQESVELAEASIRDNMMTRPEAALQEIKALYRKLEVDWTVYSTLLDTVLYCTLLYCTESVL